MAKRTASRPRHGPAVAPCPRSHRSRRARNRRRRASSSSLPRAMTPSCSAVPLRRILGPAFAAAMLLGAAAALLLASLCAALEPQSDVSARSVVGGALLALALGVRVPQRFAVWVCRATFGSATGVGAAETDFVPSGGLVAPHAAERSLYWLVMAVLALACGVSIAVTPVVLRWVTSTHQVLLGNFLWSLLPLSLLNHLCALVVVIIPMSLLGTAISCAHHLCCPRGEWDERAAAWGLLGAGGGLLLVRPLVAGVPASVVIVAAALPALLVSLLSATLGSADTQPPRTTGRDRPVAPACADRWPTLLRSALVAVAGGGAFAASMWCQAPGTSATMLPCVLAGLGLGLALGHRREMTAVHSIGGFGARCSLAGLAIALGTLVGGLAASATMAFQAAAVGYAVSYGQQALLSRVGSRSAAGAYELCAMLACAAGSVLVVAPLAEIVFTQSAALLMLALILIATGGTLVLYEAQDIPARRRARTGLVFASLVIMVLVVGRPGGASVLLTAVAGATGR